MQNISVAAQNFEALRGKKLVSACSSLKNFSIEFEGAVGLSIDAVMDEDESRLQLTVVDAAKLPKASDAVCSVDWSWIYGSSVTKLAFSGSAVRFELGTLGPLVVSAGVWKAEPFLSFQPFKPPVQK